MTENRSLLDILTELRDRGLEAVANASADNGRLSPQLLLEVEALAKRVDARQQKAQTHTVTTTAAGPAGSYTITGVSPQAAHQAQEEANRRARRVAGRILLSRFLAHFDVKIRTATDAPYFPADSGVCEALGITDAEYSTAVMDLSGVDAADCGTGTASSMIDALAFSAGGAR